MELNADVLQRVIRRSRTDPDFFCNEILRSPNDPWQSELMNAIADLDRARYGEPTLFNHDLRNRFSVSACQGPGKTHCLAKVIHWYNFTRVGRIPCTAPKEKQVITRVWPEIRKLLASAIDGYSSLLRVEQTKIVWLGNLDHCALVEAASQPENLQGLHDKYLLFCIEEASGVDEKMFPVIEGALTTPNAIMLMIGNPTKGEGEFFNSRNDPENSKLYYNMRISYLDSPRISRKWVEGMRRKYGEKSPIFKIRCLGEDAGKDANQLLELYWLDRAVCDDKSDWEDGSFPRLRISVDVSDGGEDETIICVEEHRDSNVCLRQMTRHSWEPSIAVIEAADLTEKIAIEWGKQLGINPKDIELIVDAIGVGAGTAGLLIQKGYNVRQYRGGSTEGVRTDRYRNRRTQSYLTFRDALRDGTFLIAPDAIDKEDWNDFCKQCLSIRSKAGNERLEDLETKEEMKRRGIKSPDMPDSVVMGFADKLPSLHSASGEINAMVIPSRFNQDY